MADSRLKQRQIVHVPFLPTWRFMGSYTGSFTGPFKGIYRDSTRVEGLGPTWRFMSSYKWGDP